MGALVFVEGVPGTGKSTIAQFIARQLARDGRPARWIYESEHPHPLVPEVPAGGYRSWDEFTAVRVDAWRTFAADVSGGRETVVVESALLQHPVSAMLQRNAERAAIEDLVRRLAGAVAALQPHLVHLRDADPARAWRAVGMRRGAPWIAQHVARAAAWEFTQSRGLAGLEAVLAYWREHGALCDAIVAWLPMAITAVDAASAAWPARRRQICAALGVSADEPAPPSPGDVRAMVGRYRNGPNELTVDFQDGGLVLRGQLWTTNALLPVARHVFDVEAWPYQVTFETDATGTIGALRWSAPRVADGPAGTYVRDE